MNLLQISTMPLLLFLLLVMGAGCGEEEQKAKDRGKAIVDTVKDAEQNVNDAMSKMQEKVNQFEDPEK